MEDSVIHHPKVKDKTSTGFAGMVANLKRLNLALPPKAVTEFTLCLYQRRRQEDSCYIGADLFQLSVFSSERCKFIKALPIHWTGCFLTVC